MKYKIVGYQVIYSEGSRDKVKLLTPILTEDIEAVRTNIRMKHNILGMKCVGVNLEYEELNT